MPASRRERLYAWTAAILVVVTWATLYWARFASEWLRARGLLAEVLVGVFAVAALAVLAGMVVRSARARTRPRAAEIAVLALFAAVYAAVVLPLIGRPEEALHFVQYGAVGGFAYAALVERRQRLAAAGTAGWLAPPVAPAAAAFLLSAAAGWVDEGIQHLLPNRYYDLRDVAFNAAAGALAIAAMVALRWARRRRSPTPTR